MKSAALALAFTFAAIPALAGNFGFDIPNLTFPETTTTTSTMDCQPATATTEQAAVCK